MKIIYKKSIVKDVKNINDKNLILKIENIINEIKLAENISEVKNVRRLKGHSDAFRIRIGDYRLGFFLENDEVILCRFLKRNDIYKLFP